MKKISAIIADDEPLARERVRSLLLDEADVEIVAECPDGAQTLKEVQKRQPDLLFLDVQMPRLDGIEATRRIRDLGNGTSLAPIIALTADAEGMQRERCLAAGMTEVLAKPIMPPLLIATVTRLLQKRATASVTIH